MHAIKENRIPIMIALIQWFFTTVFQVDRIFFSYDLETNIYIQIKMLYCIFLLVAWSFIFYVYKKWKARESIYERGIYIFFIYLFLMMVLLLILWPGTWSWDDLTGLIIIQNYKSLNPWQHIITSYYQDILLQIFPFPGGIVLLQNVFISACVAFCVAKIESSFGISRIKNKLVDIMVKLFPFMLPPVLMYQFSGYRMGLYVYLELTMLVVLICAIKDKKEWSKGYLFFFCFLSVIVASWRTESFLYILFSCLLIIFMKKNILSNSKKIFACLVLIVGFIGMHNLQSNALGNSNYEVMSILRPCVELVRAADEVEDAEILVDINKVVSLDVIYENPTLNGEELYWNTNVVKDGYTSEDYTSLLKALVKLSIKYPIVLISERGEVFIKGTGITGETYTNVDRSSILFDEENDNEAAAIVMGKKWFANTPVLKMVEKY